MSTTSQIRDLLFLMYPQWKPKFPLLSTEYTNEITRIETFIDQARLECNLYSTILGSLFDKALVLLSCHELTIALPQGFTNGSIEWEERETTRTRYSPNKFNESDHSQTKYGQQFDKMICSLRANSSGGIGAFPV